MRQQVGPDARTLVAHGQDSVGAVALGDQANAPGALGELGSVVQQVRHHLRESRGVRFDP